MSTNVKGEMHAPLSPPPPPLSPAEARADMNKTMARRLTEVGESEAEVRLHDIMRKEAWLHMRIAPLPTMFLLRVCCQT